MATPTRFSPPGSIHFVTHRTTQGEFRLRPDAPLVQNFYYLLACMQERYSLEFHTGSVLSNHPHLLLTDTLGDRIQLFNRDFFSLLSRSTNCYWGRSENLINSRRPNCVLVAPRAEDIIDKAAYIAVNMVEAGLVSHAKKWPGVRVLASEMGTLTMRIKRPEFFYNPKGPLPEYATLRFTVPKVWDMDKKALKRAIEQECNRREGSIRERMRRAGRRFMGAKRVKRQSPRSRPRNRKTWFDRVPHLACKDRDLRVRFIQWRQERQRRYEAKRRALLEGVKDVLFPEGTFALWKYGGQAREPWQG